MRVAQIPKAGAPFEIVDRPIPEPGPRQVQIKVDACGICHSDQIFKEGQWPGLKFPVVPGHEVAGRVTKIGPNVHTFKVGQRVGVGWNGGYCSECAPCRAGDFPFCTTGATTAAAFDGGYAEYMVAPETAVAAMPEELDPLEAAPHLARRGQGEARARTRRPALHRRRQRRRGQAAHCHGRREGDFVHRA
jgi:D-arabinose 1-dehydrogenase-like Zn-dependent alcohol dehydrogenase